MPLDDKSPSVPGPNFGDPVKARQFTEDALVKRPWRPRFFAAFEAELNAHFDRPIRVAEIGSGPGHLAKAILDGCNIDSYTAIDLSAAMHALAREHLGDGAGRAQFAQRDFGQREWVDGLGIFDAVVTMISVHEVRHKSRQPALVKDIHDVIAPGGLLLFCDRYFGPANADKPELYLTRDEQAALLESTGFVDVELLLDEESIALYRAYRLPAGK